MSEQSLDRERAYDALSDASLGFTALAFVQDTDVAAAQGLPSIPSDATIAVVQAEGDVRWRLDGTNPTASVGMLLPDGAERTFIGINVAAVKLIARTTGASVNVQYFKAPT